MHACRNCVKIVLPVCIIMGFGHWILLSVFTSIPAHDIYLTLEITIFPLLAARCFLGRRYLCVLQENNNKERGRSYELLGPGVRAPYSWHPMWNGISDKASQNGKRARIRGAIWILNQLKSKPMGPFWFPRPGYGVGEKIGLESNGYTHSKGLSASVHFGGPQNIFVREKAQKCLKARKVLCFQPPAIFGRVTRREALLNVGVFPIIFRIEVILQVIWSRRFLWVFSNDDVLGRCF